MEAPTGTLASLLNFAIQPRLTKYRYEQTEEELQHLKHAPRIPLRRPVRARLCRPTGTRRLPSSILNPDTSDHRGIKQSYYPTRMFGSFAAAARFCTAHDELREYFRPRCPPRQPSP